MKAYDVYTEWLGRWSDVQEHLVRLYNRSHGLVVELGVRHGVSTSALLAGVEMNGGTLLSIDRDPDCEFIFARGHPQWVFFAQDSETPLFKDGAMPAVDLLFIDTEHTEGKTLRELQAWGPWMKPGATIFLHDTDDGSTYPGVRKAIHEFCNYEKQYWLYPGSYGLGEIRC